jgi:hypothetical protein
MARPTHAAARDPVSASYGRPPLSAIRFGWFLARLPDGLRRPLVAAGLERLPERSGSSSWA